MQSAHLAFDVQSHVCELESLRIHPESGILQAAFIMTVCATLYTVIYGDDHSYLITIHRQCTLTSVNC